MALPAEFKDLVKQPGSPAAQPTNLGPGSGCFPKYGCTE